MKLNLSALLCLLTLGSTAVVAADNHFKPSDGKQIVGGEQAEPNAWPWVAALVYTYEDIETSLMVDGQVYTSDPFELTPSGTASGLLMDCGLGDSQCDATAQICLIQRGDITFAEKALNCEAGGGVGVVIYNNVEGAISGTLGLNFEGTIPIVAVTQKQGETLLDKIGTQAEIEVAAAAELVQSSTCGGTFIGDRWVLTASHCVDGPNAQYLKVNVGEYDLRNGAAEAIDVKNIYLHGDYDDEALVNDIALIELAESPSSASAVSLGSTAATEQAAADNSMVTVIGWGGRAGYEAGGGPTSDFPNILHQVDLTLFDNQECGDMLATAQGVTQDVTPEQMGIASVMICAGTYDGGKGSCQGDSGGPLILETNEGHQQIGVVSWGIGCAAKGYPGVYARVSEFLPWIDGISKGIAMQQNLTLGYLPTNTAVSSKITITNNSELSTTLSFTPDNSAYQIDGSACANLAAGASCEADVTFNASVTGNFDGYITVSSSTANIATTRTKVSAEAVNASATLGAEFATSSNISWYTGGDASWTDNPTDDGVQSGVIDNLQSSILLAQIEGEGVLTFEWAVSSEENVDDPESPYDALYVYINGGQHLFISGEVDFEEVEIELGEGTNHVAWVYEKDPFTKEFDDTGYVKNVEFEAKNVTNPTNPTPTGSTNENKRSSGGLGFGGLMLMVISMFVVLRRRG